jgi:hypothetical protein
MKGYRVDTTTYEMLHKKLPVVHRQKQETTIIKYLIPNRYNLLVNQSNLYLIKAASVMA